MGITNFFSNVSFPVGCIYTIQAEAKGKCEGEAEVEVIKATNAVEEAVIQYAEEARGRCSASG